uniref:BHLH domain-containing protein n=1 Tax=Timema shepardi TaxID=629360 RepID=A0A7R9ARI7_TIMSH|nr:unnamed protein product [Timema shepardi]
MASLVLTDSSQLTSDSQHLVIMKKNTLVCQFASPLDVDTHNKPEAVVLEGKYWKRKLAAVTAEYKKWRMFYRNRFMGWGTKDGSDLLAEMDMFDWQPHSNDSLHSMGSMMVDEDYMEFMSDTLFTSITYNQPFAFPDTREITRGTNIADFMQPSLVQLQPNLDDFMDTLEPLQELLSSRLPPVPEEPPSELEYRSIRHMGHSFPELDLLGSNLQSLEHLQHQQHMEQLQQMQQQQQHQQQQQTEAQCSAVVYAPSVINQSYRSTTPQDFNQVHVQHQQQTGIMDRVSKSRPPRSVQNNRLLQQQQRQQQSVPYQQQQQTGLTQSSTYQGFAIPEVQPQPLQGMRVVSSPSSQQQQSPVSLRGLPATSQPVYKAPSPQPPSMQPYKFTTQQQNFRYLQLGAVLIILSWSSFLIPAPEVTQVDSIAVQDRGPNLNRLFSPTSTQSYKVYNLSVSPPVSSIPEATITSPALSPLQYNQLNKRSHSGSALGMGSVVAQHQQHQHQRKHPPPLVSSSSDSALNTTLSTGGLQPLLAHLLTTSMYQPPPPCDGLGNRHTSGLYNFTAADKSGLKTSSVVPILPMPSGAAPGPKTTTALLITTPVSMTSMQPSGQILLNTMVAPSCNRGADSPSDSSAVPSPASLNISPLSSPLNLGSPLSPQKQIQPRQDSERAHYRSPKNINAAPPKEHRRMGHINAEQKRRCNIKNGFDMLHSLIPQLNQNPNAKLSKAAMLQKGADHIRQLRSDRSQLREEMESLKKQIESLNAAISNCQSMLPATGAPVSRQRSSKMKEMFDEYVRFSILFEPLLVSFNQMVSTASLEDLFRSTLLWVEQHSVLNSLRYLSTATDIMTDPSKLPEEARRASAKPSVRIENSHS